MTRGKGRIKRCLFYKMKHWFVKGVWVLETFWIINSANKASSLDLVLHQNLYIKTTLYYLWIWSSGLDSVNDQSYDSVYSYLVWLLKFTSSRIIEEASKAWLLLFISFVLNNPMFTIQLIISIVRNCFISKIHCYTLSGNRLHRFGFSRLGGSPHEAFFEQWNTLTDLEHFEGEWE